MWLLSRYLHPLPRQGMISIFLNNPIGSLKHDFHVICILKYILNPLTKQDMATYEYKFHFGFYAMKQLYQKKKKKEVCEL